MPKRKAPSKVWIGVRGFFVFWKDFLVGDSPVLALGVLIILAAAYLLHNSPVLAPAVAILLVLVLITFTVWQKTKTRHGTNNQRNEQTPVN